MHTIEKFKRLLKKHKGYAVVFLLMCYLFFLLKYPDSYTLGIIVSVGATAAIYAITGNFFFSLFSIYVVSLPLKVPAKQYSFQYAAPTEYQYDLLPEGIYDSIYYTVSTVWGALLVLFFINRLLRYVVVKKSERRNAFLSFFRNHLITFSLVSWLVFFVLSVYSSLYFSFNPSYSINYLLHESNIIIASISVLYLFLVEKAGAYYFSLILCANIMGYGLIGISQVLHLFTEQSYVQSLPIIDPEETELFRRINGALGPNRSAYLITTLSLMLLPFTRFIKRRVILFSVWFIAIINIVFSQSRSVWLGLCLVAFLYYIWKRKRLYSMFYRIPRKILFPFTSIIVVLLIVIVIPRISVLNIFFEGGGGALREKMIAEGLQLLRLSPWLGFGSGTSTRALLNNFPSGYIHEFPDSPHIAYLQMAIESGIPATIAFFIPFFLFIRQMFILKIKNKWKNDILLCVVSCIILSLVYLSFQPIFGRTDLSYLGIILALGVVALIQTNRQSYENTGVDKKI